MKTFYRKSELDPKDNIVTDIASFLIECENCGGPLVVHTKALSQGVTCSCGIVYKITAPVFVYSTYRGLDADK